MARRRMPTRSGGDPAPDDRAVRRQEALYLLRRLTVEVDAFARGFADAHDLHATDVRALVALLDARFAGEDMTPGRLAAQVGLSSASTTALLDRLERAGHLVRRPHPTDRRRTVVEPTAHALAEGAAWFGALNRDMHGVLTDLDDADVEVLHSVLADLVAVVRRHLDEGR